VKRDMQKIILKILIESKKNKIPYLTRGQIVEKIKKIKPNVNHLERKTSQALYLLNIKKRKWNEPKVIKKGKGWTIEDEKYG